jgi:hypothetical protein
MWQPMLERYVSSAEDSGCFLQPTYPSPRRQSATESRSSRIYTPATRNHHSANRSRRLLFPSHSKSIHKNCTNPTSHWRILVSSQAPVCSLRRMDSSSHCTGLGSMSPRGSRLEMVEGWRHSPPLCRDRCHSCGAQTPRDRPICQTLTVDSP